MAGAFTSPTGLVIRARCTTLTAVVFVRLQVYTGTAAQSFSRWTSTSTCRADLVVGTNVTAGTTVVLVNKDSKTSVVANFVRRRAAALPCDTNVGPRAR